MRALFSIITLVLTGLALQGQTLQFTRPLDTVYYIDYPLIYSTLVPSGTPGSAYGLSLRVESSKGHLLHDSLQANIYSNLEYSKDFISISGVEANTGLYAASCLSQGKSLYDGLDSLNFVIALEGILPEDTVVEINLSDIYYNDIYGNTGVVTGDSKTVMLVLDKDLGIDDTSSDYYGNLKALYNPVDGTITLDIPGDININRFSVFIYDINGRLMIRQEIYDRAEKIETGRLIDGIYLIEILYKQSNQLKMLSCKCTISLI